MQRLCGSGPRQHRPEKRSKRQNSPEKRGKRKTKQTCKGRQSPAIASWRPQCLRGSCRDASVSSSTAAAAQIGFTRANTQPGDACVGRGCERELRFSNVHVRARTAGESVGACCCPPMKVCAHSRGMCVCRGVGACCYASIAPEELRGAVQSQNIMTRSPHRKQ